MKNLIFVAVLFSLAFCYSCSDDNTSDLNQDLVAETTNHVHADGRTCGQDAYMDKLLSNPTYRAAYEKRMEKHKTYVSQSPNSRAACSSPTTLPVAVHFQGVTGNISCLTTVAQDAIAILNADYQGTNGDITNWTGNASSSFPGISNGEACLEFVLADTNHPSGYGLVNGDLAVTRNVTSGDFDSNWSGYLNIFVGNAGGALGYSPLGGAGNGDGVMIDKSYFATATSCGNVSATSPFNLGRTLTHEVGHYLNLDHIWGNGCGTDDGISDTPESKEEYYDCPTIGESSCSSTDLHMNYMDYTNDACMYMFTAGQATENENYVASSLSNITSNASSVISGNGGGGNGGGSGGGGTASCDKPGSSSVASLTNTSVKVTWETMANAIKYQIKYRIVSTTSWTTKTVTVSEKTLTNLTVASNYEYKLRTKCPSGWTSFTPTETFTTSGGGSGGGSTTCDMPGFTSTEYLTATRTKVSWEAMPQAVRYQVRYRLSGSSSWTTKASNTTNRTLTGLQNGGTYEYKVRTKCPSGWTSYTATETFTQTAGGGGSSNNTIHFNLTLDNYGSETTWELVDDSNNVISSGGPFTDGTSGTVISETFNIADGCYTVYVDDAYGDGICCDYGNGSFEILDINNNQVGYSDGEFGNYDFIDFCVINNVASFKGEEKDEKELNLAPKTLLTRF